MSEKDERAERFKERATATPPPGPQPSGNGDGYHTEIPEPPKPDVWMDGAAFDAAKFRYEWAIEDVFVLDHVGVCCGPNKSMKTTTMADAVISVGSGTPFLGHFRVPQKLPCLFVTLESGKPTIQDMARRICRSKGIDLRDTLTYWHFDPYHLSSASDLQRLNLSIRHYKPRVAIFDPFYLLAFGGDDLGQAGDATNMFAMGGLLLKLTTLCLSAGCTPIIAHHVTKQASRSFEPLTLEDIAFSGVPQFARQWALINRREPFVEGGGDHALWLSVGGSPGQSGLYQVDITEGTLQRDFSGRTYQVETTRSGSRRQAKEEAQRREKSKRITEDGTVVLEVLDRKARSKSGVKAMVLNELNQHTGLSKERVRLAIADLLDTNIIEEVPTMRKTGTNNKVERAYVGYQRITVSTD